MRLTGLIWRGPKSLTIKVHMTRKISHSKNTLILKAFQSRVKWSFSFCDFFFCSRDIQVFLVCKFNHWWRHPFHIHWWDTKVRISLPIMKHGIETWQGCSALRNILDGTHFHVAMATCSVPVSCLFKVKCYHLHFILRLFYSFISLRRRDQSTVFCIVSFDFNWSRSPKIRHPFALVVVVVLPLWPFSERLNSMS